MNYTQTQEVILEAIAQTGLAFLGIITAIMTIAVAYLVFKFGWKRVITDKSLMIGGFYLRNTPYKGYNRFRSAKWNMKNTM